MPKTKETSASRTRKTAVIGGKQYFKECCTKLGLDCDALFQMGERRTPVSDRLNHSFDYFRRKESQIFAVCYVTHANVYVAWSLKISTAQKRSNFSVKWPDDRVLFDGSVNIIGKHLQFSGHGTENVYIFSLGAVTEFLKKYCGGSV